MSAPALSFEALAEAYAAPAPFCLRLRLEELTVGVCANNAALADDLRRYFAPFACCAREGDAGGAGVLLGKSAGESADRSADRSVNALPGQAPGGASRAGAAEPMAEPVAESLSKSADLEFLFLDGPVREPLVELAVRQHLPGKKPDKERFADLPSASVPSASMPSASMPGESMPGASVSGANARGESARGESAPGAGISGAGALNGGGRLVRKQATGMLFLFRHGVNDANIAANIAIGPCAQNRNQLVNFICARYMERRVAAGWLLGHAAGVALDTGERAKSLALCGFAGMGKSTLALHLLARGCDFLSNDRVLVEPRPGAAPVLHGIPKHPRLNPGTALGNPELAPHLARALPDALRAAYAGLAPSALYAVEDKFDALIDECFGPERLGGDASGLPGPQAEARPDASGLANTQDNTQAGTQAGAQANTQANTQDNAQAGAQASAAAHAAAGRSRFRLAAPLSGLVVLNWRHGGGPMQARRVDLASRPDLLAALRKPPGVFYLPQALATARLSAQHCLETLSGVPVLELSGGSDFSAGAQACLEFLQ